MSRESGLPFSLPSRGGGTVDAEIEAPSAENPELFVFNVALRPQKP